MKTTTFDIEGPLLLELDIWNDHRGCFMETWNFNVFSKLGVNYNFVQDNYSKSIKNVLRGLHFQTQNCQGKLVRVISGCIYDVIVDLRKQSKTLGKWIGVILDSNNKVFWVPPGFAHGFLTMSDIAEVTYKCTDVYNPEFERTLKWNDERLNINWGIEDPIMSEKDSNGISFDQIKLFNFT